MCPRKKGFSRKPMTTGSGTGAISGRFVTWRLNIKNMEFLVELCIKSDYLIKYHIYPVFIAKKEERA